MPACAATSAREQLTNCWQLHCFPPPQIDVTLVVILGVRAVSGGCIVRYQCLFPTVALAQNFVVVIRERPTVVFAASPVVVFQRTTIRTVNVVNPGARSQKRQTKILKS